MPDYGFSSGAPVPNVRVFTSSTTYTPTPGTRWCEVEMVGAGGGTPALTSNTGGVSIAAGGGSGSYIKVQCLPSDISGQTITVGASTSTGSATAGSSSIGSLIVAPGGNVTGTATISSASLAANTAFNTNPTAQSAAPTSSVGTVLVAIQGQGAAAVICHTSEANAADGIVAGSAGGSNPLGVGGFAGNDAGPFARGAAAGTGYGSGAGSSTASNNGTATARLGQPGVVIIREFF